MIGHHSYRRTSLLQMARGESRWGKRAFVFSLLCVVFAQISRAEEEITYSGQHQHSNRRSFALRTAVPLERVSVHISFPKEESELADKGIKPISQLTAFVPVNEGESPPNPAAEWFAVAESRQHVTGFSRYDVATEVNWEPTAICHQPLYFEEVNVERHGYHVKYLQPLLSGAHFFSHVPAVPYLVISQKHRECTYTLGHYRPGSPAPYLWYFPRFSLDGAALEAGLITGLMYAIP